MICVIGLPSPGGGVGGGGVGVCLGCAEGAFASTGRAGARNATPKQITTRTASNLKIRASAICNSAGYSLLSHGRLIPPVLLYDLSVSMIVFAIVMVKIAPTKHRTTPAIRI